MLKRNRHSKAQTISEYVILVGLIGAALIGMRVYMQRGIQGVVKAASDELGKQKDAEETDPEKGTKTDSAMGTKVYSSQRTQITKGAGQARDFFNQATSSGTSTYVSTARSEE